MRVLMLLGVAASAVLPFVERVPILTQFLRADG